MVDLARMSDFACPSYDGDEESANGIPQPANELRRRLEACDAVVIASPEYNASMPGVLKNAIDWASGFRPQPFHQKQCLLLSAPIDGWGKSRALVVASAP